MAQTAEDRQEDIQHDYPDLENEVADLQRMAAPLNKRVVVSPLMPVISRIMSLDQSLQGASPERVAFVEREVKECKRLLDAMSYHYVESIISHATPSKVFQILASANDFALLLKRSVGKKIKSKDPEGNDVELTITPKIVEFLTRFKFSLGTPPVSPEGIKVVEKLLFGGDLQSLYAFRDTLKGGPRDKIIFDRLIASVSRVVSDSTHYTTKDEAEKLENEATDYNGFEGLRGFSRTVISGGSDTKAIDKQRDS